jgi:hypothetical protein
MIRLLRLSLPLVPALWVGLVASSSYGADGVLEINQACATVTGCFPGDTAGFPVTVNGAGSYALTSNLSVSAPGVSGIVIAATDVSLDLGGFAIAGPGSCTGSGSGLSCTAVGSGRGVDGGPRVQVRNGGVRGFGELGVSLGDRARVDGMIVESNGAGGIAVGLGSLVRESISSSNAGLGFSAEYGVVRGCSATSNKQAGFSGQGTSYVGNQASLNGTHGIDARGGSLVRDSVASLNAQEGIVVYAGSLVSDNSSTANGASGVAALSTSSIQRNVVVGNNTFGLYLFPELGGTAAAYRENVISGGSIGRVVNGINMGANSCNGATVCP